MRSPGQWLRKGAVTHITWDSDQVLQLLLQVHDVLAELNVIHPVGEEAPQETLLQKTHLGIILA